MNTNSRNLTLLTDLYELTMMQGYFKTHSKEHVVFDVFYRQNPCGGAYAIACGLDQAIDYIKDLHFEQEDIDYLRSTGFYSGAAITTILVLVIYRFMGRVDEIAYEHSRVLDIYIEFESRRSIAPFISVLKQNNYKIVQMELNKSKKNKEELVNATLVLEVPEKTKHGIVIDLLREIPGIEYVEEI